MKLSTALRLGRVSNLPTVVTNAVAGMVLAGAGVSFGPLAMVVAAAALAYVAGMFLNDAFDADMDAVDQPYRPIPAGLASRNTVFALGYGMLAAGVVLFAAAGLSSGNGWWAGGAAVVLAGVVVAYNRSHKENAFGPLLMGLCRALVYFAAGFAAASALPPALWLGAAMLLAHIMGLTFVAKREGAGLLGRIWPLLAIALPLVYGLILVPGQPIVLTFVIALALADAVALRLCFGPAPKFSRAIPLLIAAVSLLDAMMVASAGLPWLAFAAALGFPLTLVLQRWVRGT